MSTYLINFLVYSMAMVGLLFICLMVYKKTMGNNKFSRNSEEFSVENALNLSPRKTLYVIKTGSERFLIAADAERTAFLAKLNEHQNIPSMPEITQEPVVTVDVESPNFKTTFNQYKSEQKTDYGEIAGAIRMTRKKPPLMREILRKLDETSIVNEETESKF